MKIVIAKQSGPLACMDPNCEAASAFTINDSQDVNTKELCGLHFKDWAYKRITEKLSPTCELVLTGSIESVK